MTNQELIGLMPLSSGSLGNLGFCYANIGQLDKALSLYEKVVKLLSIQIRMSGSKVDSKGIFRVFSDITY